LVCEKVLSKLDVDKAKATRQLAKEIHAAARAVEVARDGDDSAGDHAECLERLGALAMQGHELLGSPREPTESPSPPPMRPVRRASQPRRPAALERKASQPRLEQARLEQARLEQARLEQARLEQGSVDQTRVEVARVVLTRAPRPPKTD